jgi:hypothetical protein
MCDLVGVVLLLFLGGVVLLLVFLCGEGGVFAFVVLLPLGEGSDTERTPCPMSLPDGSRYGRCPLSLPDASRYARALTVEGYPWPVLEELCPCEELGDGCPCALLLEGYGGCPCPLALEGECPVFEPYDGERCPCPLLLLLPLADGRLRRSRVSCIARVSCAAADHPGAGGMSCGKGICVCVCDGVCDGVVRVCEAVCVKNKQLGASVSGMGCQLKESKEAE